MVEFMQPPPQGLIIIVIVIIIQIITIIIIIIIMRQQVLALISLTGIILNMNHVTKTLQFNIAGEGHCSAGVAVLPAFSYVP